MRDESVSPSSSPCLLGENQSDIAWLESASDRHALINGLSHCFGMHSIDSGEIREARFLTQLGSLFRKVRVEPEAALEAQGCPGQNVYMVQYGVLRLGRETLAGKMAIHHFFSEGDLVCPVFGRNRALRNRFHLVSVTPATLWVADFSCFKAAVQQQDTGAWEKFALVRTKKQAELASTKAFRDQTMSARERYQVLVEGYPELVKRVPDNQLASWLGIAAATFSRFKRPVVRR